MATMGPATFTVLVIGGVAGVVRYLFEQAPPLSVKAAQAVRALRSLRQEIRVEASPVERQKVPG
ncbi:hypothetical protein ABT330_32895 [Streptomyces sp. NPDC000658]|uniref:hypothetical protein n=1 Tax=Streptomyces sp. NPDC000658 TaxID=3154266 RepID=UPI003327CA34